MVSPETEKSMSKKTTPSLETSSEDLIMSLYRSLLQALETEIAELPKTLQGLSPEKRVEFLSNTLPLLFKIGGFVGETAL